MQLRDIAFLNLRRRKAKAAFVLAGLIAGVATMVALVSLAEALSAEVNHKLEKYGANILITPRTENLSLSYGGLSLGGFSFETHEIRQADLARIKHIKNAANLAAVGPMVLGAVDVGGRKALLAGVDFETTWLLKPWWKIQGRQPDRSQALLGSEAARVLGMRNKERFTVRGHELTVSGVLDPTGSQDDGMIFTTLATAQLLLNKTGLISMVEVAALCKDCPVDEMVTQISQVLPGATVTAIRSVVEGRMRTLAQFKQFSLGVSALVALVGALVVLVTMMGSVRERSREIGIFRAIGFRKGHIMRVVLTEAGVLSLSAGVLGWLLGLLGCYLALPWFSSGEAHIIFSLRLFVTAVVMALSAGILSSIYPAAVAARQDPAQALRSL